MKYFNGLIYDSHLFLRTKQEDVIIAKLYPNGVIENLSDFLNGSVGTYLYYDKETKYVYRNIDSDGKYKEKFLKVVINTDDTYDLENVDIYGIKEGKENYYICSLPLDLYFEYTRILELEQTEELEYFENVNRSTFDIWSVFTDHQDYLVKEYLRAHKYYTSYVSDEKITESRDKMIKNHVYKQQKKEFKMPFIDIPYKTKLIALLAIVIILSILLCIFVTKGIKLFIAIVLLSLFYLLYRFLS